MVNFCKIVRGNGQEIYVNADTVAFVTAPAGNSERVKSLIQFVGETSVDSAETAVDTARRLNDGVWPYVM